MNMNTEHMTREHVNTWTHEHMNSYYHILVEYFLY